MNKVSKLWPLFIIAFISWYSYIMWLERRPQISELSNSIEAKDTVISSKVTGRIKEIFIEEGSIVKKGDVILVLQADELYAQIEQNQAILEKSNSELNDLKNGARKQEIISAKSESLIGKSEILKARSELEKVKLNHERAESLHKEGAISKKEYEASQVDYKKAIETVNSTELNFLNLKERESLVIEGARKEKINSLHADVKAQRAKLKELNILKDELTITAPIDGEISSFDLEIGELISANSPITTITDLSDLYARFYISSTQLNKVKTRDMINVSVDSYPKEVFNGEITYISSTAEFSPRNIQTKDERSKLVYPIKVKIENKENKLRNGMYATIEI